MKPPRTPTKSPVIELGITAWHPCSVWKVAGGRQPRYESLPVPKKFNEQLAAWRRTFDASCAEPTYSGRKDHDAQGLVIARQLQQALACKNIHVVFRHWVKFDPKRRRSHWRAENLFTGESKRFWLGLDLPGGLETKVLSISPELGEVYLWDLNRECLGVEDVGGSADLDERFRKWATRWAECLAFEPYKLDRKTLTAEHFDQAGLTLAAELKRVVADKSRVIYYSVLQHACAELMADGTIKKRPLNAD